MLHKERVVYSFSTTSEAMKAEKIFLSNGAPGGIIPLPSKIAAGCGLAWTVDKDKAQLCDEVIEKSDINVDKRSEIFL